MDNLETDVLVVGGGGTGLAAAVAAAQNGAQVILIEKNTKLGGTTGLSIGSISASCTPQQRKAGVEDSFDAHFEDMTKFAAWKEERDNPTLRRLLVENSAGTIAWLESFGVEFFGPFTEPPHRVPRMHNVLPSSRAFIDRLEKAARRLGVQILLGAAAQKLIVDGGRVVATEVTQDGQMRQIRARRAIVLGGGDFSNNREMKTQWGSPEVGQIPGVNVTATGDCQRMILEIGGEILNGDLICGPRLRFNSPPQKKLHELAPSFPLFARLMRWALEYVPQPIIRPFVLRFMTTVLGPEPALYREGAMLANELGERCVIGTGGAGEAVARQLNQRAFVVFDDAIARKFSQYPYFVSTAPGIAYAYMDDYRKTRPDICRSAATLSALAETIGVDPSKLVDSVVAHNQAGNHKLLQAPFHCLGPMRAYVTMTEGGARVSDRLEVIANGSPIPNLFAAGSTGQGGLLLEGHGHHLGWAFTSGRIAGIQAAKIVP